LIGDNRRERLVGGAAATISKAAMATTPCMAVTVMTRSSAVSATTCCAVAPVSDRLWGNEGNESLPAALARHPGGGAGIDTADYNARGLP